MQKAQKGTFAPAADLPGDEPTAARLVADLRREIDDEVCLRFGRQCLNGPATLGPDVPQPAILLPSAVFWIDARQRVAAALAKTAVLPVVATAPLPALSSRIRAKLRAIAQYAQSSTRGVERRWPEGSLCARGLAVAKRLWRSARNRGWIASPLALPVPDRPCLPWVPALMELMTALQRRDQIRERDSMLGKKDVVSAFALESRPAHAA